MSKYTQNKVRRVIEAKANARGVGDNVTASVTQEMVRADFVAFRNAEAATDKARSNLLRTALMFSTSHLSVVLAWDAAWNDLRSSGNSKDAVEKRANARALVTEFFGVPATTKDTSEEQAAQNRRDARAVEYVVELCVAVHRHKFSDGFEFPKAGGSFVKTGTTLHAALWKEHEYSKVKKLNEPGWMESHPLMLINFRRDQVSDGETSWDHVKKVAMTAMGDGRTVTGSEPHRTQVAANMKKPTEVLASLAATIGDNKNGVATNKQKLDALTHIQTALEVAFSGPLFAEGWNDVHTGFNRWRKLLAAAPVQVISPPVVVNLPRVPVPAGTQAKTLPHPNNAANNTTPKVEPIKKAQPKAKNKASKRKAR